MNLHELYSTPERERLLSHFLDRDAAPININGLARELGLSPGLVHKYVGILKRNGFVEHGALVDNALTRSLRLIKNLTLLENIRFAERARKKISGVKGMGIYGSWSKGSNGEGSDLDLWLKCDQEVEDRVIARAGRELSAIVEVPVEILVATPKRMEHIRKTSESLYHSLFGSILLWGDEL